MRSHSTCLLLATVAIAGCGVPEQVKQQVADAVGKLEAETAKVFAAFDDGDPKAADGPMHKIGKPFQMLKTLTSKLGLDEQGVTALTDAREELLGALAEVHKPMHEPVFPEDFDFAPIRQKLIDGFAALRAALPPEIADRLPESPLTEAPATLSEEAPNA